MINQLDPMIQACKKEVYEEHFSPRKDDNQEDINTTVKIDTFFCAECKKLITNERCNKPIRDGRKCNKCSINS